MRRRIIRKPEVLKRLGIGRTKFEEDYRRRLRSVRLGERAVGYVEDEVDALVDELIAARDEANAA
jgi:predicted DNA-binding transcriptional regulator AlpA